MSETCGGLGFVTSLIERDSRGKGAVAREETGSERQRPSESQESTDGVTAVGRDRGAARSGWHCPD